MKTMIKNYWQALKQEYEDTYNEAIFANNNHYEKAIPFVNKFNVFLNENYKETPTNIDIVCALATVMLELRHEKEGIALLEEFLKTYEEELSNEDKARLYTNLAYYHSEYDSEYYAEDKDIKYLLKAVNLNSPFLETYKGLALYYFNDYAFEESKDSLEKSLKTYETALQLTDGYDYKLGYASCLFEFGKYREAKKTFQELLEEYPDKMRVLLALAYCDIYLGNPDKAMHYLSMIRIEEDPRYQLITDEIDELELYDALYVLGEYERFLEAVEKSSLAYHLGDGGDSYYYALWATLKVETFEQKVTEEKNRIIELIEDAKVDEDFANDEDRQKEIDSLEQDWKNLIKSEHHIRYDNQKPTIKLSLCPEGGCYLIDCIRHQS